MFGLDIGTSFVKIIQLRKDEAGYSATVAARVEVDQSEEGIGHKEYAGVEAAIARVLKSATIRGKYAVCGVSGPDVVVRSFNLPSLIGGELSHAVLLEAEQVCPFDIDQCMVDYQVLGEIASERTSEGDQDGGVRVYGVLAAATNEVVSRRRRLARDAGLTCVFVDVNNLALLNCFVEYEGLPSSQATAVLDIGSGSSSLAIIRADGMPFIRDMEYAGNDIIRQMAQEQQISRHEVSKLLHGAEVEAQAGEVWQESLKRALHKLTVNIIQTLRYYTVQEGARVEQVYVCGGLSQAQGVLGLLAEQLPAQVLLWNPFRKVRWQGDALGLEVLERHGPAMVVAAGLGMRAI